MFDVVIINAPARGWFVTTYLALGILLSKLASLTESPDKICYCLKIPLLYEKDVTHLLFVY